MKTVSVFGLDAYAAAPTKSHRAAVWETILGAVRAMNSAGETRYFDYDYAGALRFAGVDDSVDTRWSRNWKNGRAVERGGYPYPRPRQYVLWIREK